MIIEWKNVDVLSDGHGVIFIHISSNKAVAFIDGYEWYHGRSEKVVVETLKTDSPILAKNNIDADAIIRGVRSAVKIFIKNKKLSGRTNNTFKAWFNG